MRTEVDSDLWVTQVGTVDRKITNGWSRPRLRFQCRPDGNDEGYASAFLGQLTMADAVRFLSLGERPVVLNDAIRYAAVRDLVSVGFRVLHIPEPLCTDHVGIFTKEAEWTDVVANAFDGCFNRYIF
jgi:hypothetical protein